MNKIRKYDGHFNKEKNWGITNSINLYQCDSEKIRSKKYISIFAQKICEVISMKAYGDPIIVNFGEEERVAGYTLVQLIETSNITAHFVNMENAVYLDIFSCKEFSPEIAEEFAKDFFKAKSLESQTILR
jgi:S-adenosylmethionine/arginine decarboxylase-like enzyme